MRGNLSERVIKEAKYMIETGKTVREIAAVFNISKSTVHKDLQERLSQLNPTLHVEVTKILDQHTEVRHIRGGESTKIKYLKLRG